MEHRARRKAAKTGTERELMGQWEPKRMGNGETLPQIMARSRHIILKHKSKWNAQQTERAKILFKEFPDLEKAYGLLLRLTDIFNEKTQSSVARLNLAKWHNEVEAFGNNEFDKVLETFEKSQCSHHQLRRTRAHKCICRIFQRQNQSFQNSIPMSRRH